MSETLARRIERKHRRRVANRNAILDSARTVAAREGAGELSLRAVAAEAGYAPASVYEYFRNRAELVLALAADDLGHIARAMREAGDGKGLAPVARSALDHMIANGALSAALGTLEVGDAPLETERLFNGKLIATLSALAEGTGRAPVTERGRQADVLLVAAAITGLAVLARARRLKALGFGEQELLERLEKRFATA